MKILCVCAVEAKDYEYVKEQIAKQDLQPDEVFIYVDNQPADGINERRKRISVNQKILQTYVKNSKADIIWQIEGDGELKNDTLYKLFRDYMELRDNGFGYISGVEVGRHGLYCLGAWHVADDKKSFKSVNYNSNGIIQVDATGWYCLMARKDIWLKGISFWQGQAWGPDVNWGLSLNYNKYVDMDIQIGHKANGTVIYPTDNAVSNVEFKLNNDKWEYKIL